MPQPRPTETESGAGSGGSGYLAQYQIRRGSPNAVDLRVFLAFGTVQTEKTKTFINSKGFIIALIKSKSLQLQSNKSKKEQEKQWKQNILLLYVLYVSLGNVFGGVPLVAGWRKTKWKCFIGLRGKKNLQSNIFFPSLNNIKVNITVTPKV